MHCYGKHEGWYSPCNNVHGTRPVSARLQGTTVCSRVSTCRRSDLGWDRYLALAANIDGAKRRAYAASASSCILPKQGTVAKLIGSRTLTRHSRCTHFLTFGTAASATSKACNLNAVVITTSHLAAIRCLHFKVCEEQLCSCQWKLLE